MNQHSFAYKLLCDIHTLTQPFKVDFKLNIQMPYKDESKVLKIEIFLLFFDL
jgi:hypothetical protein